MYVLRSEFCKIQARNNKLLTIFKKIFWFSTIKLLICSLIFCDFLVESIILIIFGVILLEQSPDAIVSDLIVILFVTESLAHLFRVKRTFDDLIEECTHRNRFRTTSWVINAFNSHVIQDVCYEFRRLNQIVWRYELAIVWTAVVEWEPIVDALMNMRLTAALSADRTDEHLLAETTRQFLQYVFREKDDPIFIKARNFNRFDKKLRWPLSFNWLIGNRILTNTWGKTLGLSWNSLL